MSAALFLLLALSPHLVVSYNVDISQPIIYEDPESVGANYFGYSVSLVPGRSAVSSYSLLVGAPQFSHGTGRVYRCTGSATRGQNTSACLALEICDMKGLTPGWLGASTASGATSESTVCAPRTLVPIATKAKLSSGETVSFHFLNLHGVCYHVRGTNGGCSLSLAYDPSKSGAKGLNSAYGFSVHYLWKNDTASHQGLHLIGLPGYHTVDVETGENTTSTSVKGPDRASYGYRLIKSRIQFEQLPRTRGNLRISERGRATAVDLSISEAARSQPLHIDWESDFWWTHCYSVSSGYFFQFRELYCVVGAPSYSRKGRVDVFPMDKIQMNKTIKINGSVLGEYFGASLTTGDFDGDGRDELAVGAPHWGEVDFGRVYIYHSMTHVDFEQSRILQGEARNGQFGYTLASADLDDDGCSDLIVSAPWEDSGAVYVFYGGRDFKKENPNSQVIQRIKPSGFEQASQIQRFGFSLSQPVDIDGNGYPDLAIGAYKSGHAIVLRSRPVIDTKIELVSDPVMLQKSTKSFTVSVCVTYGGRGAPKSLDLSFNMRIDAKHNRVENGSTKQFDATFFSDNRTCVNTTISLITSEYLMVLDPIKFELLTHSIKKGVSKSKIHPVLSKRSLNEIEPLTIPFNTTCDGGQVCSARLSINASFSGVGENNVWVVGSGDIGLNIMVTNEGEPAYQTRVTIEITPGSRLRRTIEFCKTATDSFSLTCDVGNPLVRGESKNFTVDLDMSEIDKRSTGPPMLMFSITKSTTSMDQAAGSRPTMLMLYTKHVAHVILSGATETKYIDYGRAVAKSRIPIRHAYRILKLGPSPIAEAYLTIDVPTSTIGRNDSFLNITDSRLMDSSGRTFTCSIGDPPSEEDVPSRTPREIHAASDLLADLRKNNHKPKAIGRNKTIDRTVYLNCSTEGVACKRLTCDFHVSKTHEDLVKLVLEMVFDAEAFHSSHKDFWTIKFHTNASVDVLSPVISLSDLSDTRNWTASVTTLLYNIVEPRKLAPWVFPASIFLGIVLCSVVAIILFMVGFFNRSKKYEDAKTKRPLSMILQDEQIAGDDAETDPYG